MSCADSPKSFRLLDAFVGWDESDAVSLSGLNEAGGVRLAALNPEALDPSALNRYLPPARLARGCGPCGWYLVTPAPPSSRLLRFDKCTARWVGVWDRRCAWDAFEYPVAVAAWKRRVAVSDRGTNTVWVWAREGSRLAAAVRVKAPGPVAFTPCGELLAASELDESWRVLRFGPAGELRGHLPDPPAGRVERIAVGGDGTVWLVIERQGDLSLWRFKPESRRCDDHAQQARGTDEFQRATLEELRAAFEPSSLKSASGFGFCMEFRGADGLPVTCCYSWYGRPVCEDEVVAPPAPGLYDKGQLLTAALDSGIPRCRWHRVRVEAEVPQGTTVEVAVATSEEPLPTPQGDPSREEKWKEFSAGVPHPLDWQQPAPGALDFLVQQPPGRYLFLRLRLTGDGHATPAVRRIRLDFPRSTSLEQLPAVYRLSPEAEDFTERFLSLFDASIADLDRAIERYAALLDPEGVPEEVLPWLGSFLDVTFNRAWSAEQSRKILAAVPELYALRGTVEGLRRAIELIFEINPTIQELPAQRMWGAVGRGARLGAVRLFGRARARFRLGSSALSQAPLRSFGNPNEDPLTEAAFRFRVLVPPIPHRDDLWHERLVQLVESQKPAHTIAAVRVGGSGFVLGTWSAVGIDTAIAPLPAPVLGKGGNVRLGRMSVLRPGPHGPRDGFVPGRAAVGVQTVME